MKDGESVKRKLILLLALGLVVISLFLTKKNNAVDSFSTQPLATEARDDIGFRCAMTRVGTPAKRR